MRIHVDATTLIGLGTIGELDLLTTFDGELVVAPAVGDEVTTEPARTNLERFTDDADPVAPVSVDEHALEDARRILGEEANDEDGGDVQLIAAVIAEESGEVAIVSDDRRVRTTARSLGAEVTGTIGVVVRAVEAGRSGAEGKAIVRRLDSHGLHMTGELRETAIDLVDAAAERNAAERTAAEE